eukprot:2085092-Rhodomonas_salina.1
MPTNHMVLRESPYGPMIIYRYCPTCACSIVLGVRYGSTRACRIVLRPRVCPRVSPLSSHPRISLSPYACIPLDRVHKAYGIPMPCPVAAYRVCCRPTPSLRHVR